MEDTKKSYEIQEPETSCCSDSDCCAPVLPFKRRSEKIGRNDPCPCDSGRKFKMCCGT